MKFPGLIYRRCGILTIQKVNDFAPGVKILACQFYIGAPHFSKLINILYLFAGQHTLLHVRGLGGLSRRLKLVRWP
jgi:hypothetical protein